MGEFVTIQEAAEGIKKGKTLLYPTDTIWGLGCDAKNEEAIQRIKEIKNRNPIKSFILLVDSVAMLERYVREIPEVCYDIIDFATKPTTIIYDQPMDLPSSLLAEDGSIGIRVTNDNNCKKIIQLLRGPIISTSANLSGDNFPTTYAEINPLLKKEVDLILNLRLEEKMTTPSSILKIDSKNRVQIIR